MEAATRVVKKLCGAYPLREILFGDYNESRNRCACSFHRRCPSYSAPQICVGEINQLIAVPAENCFQRKQAKALCLLKR